MSESNSLRDKSGRPGDANPADRWRRVAWRIHELVVKRFPVGSEEDVRFLSVGMSGEAGEVLNQVKKAWRGDFDLYSPASLAKLREEMADTRIYLELLSRALGFDLDAAADHVVANKLRERWPAEWEHAVRGD